MNFYITAIISFSILVPAAIGCIRLKRIDATFWPFIICITAGSINEIVSFILVHNNKSNDLAYTIYGYMESVLLTLQFMLWRRPGAARWRYWLLVVFFTIYWLLTGTGWLVAPQWVQSSFKIVYSFTIIILAITAINRVIVIHKEPVLRNPMFLICSGIIIFFTYATIIEVFWLYGFSPGKTLSARIYDIMAFINLLVNIIFVFAVLWIPRKQKFLLPRLLSASS